MTSTFSKKITTRLVIVIGTISISLLLAPLLASAQSQNLINIPQAAGGFNGYINAVYAMFISVAALLAVVKVIVAGVKYMFSDVVTQKSAAKKDIQGALLGLLIVLAAVLILTVINPNLTNFNLNLQLTQTIPRPAAQPPVSIQNVSCAVTDTSSANSWCSRANCQGNWVTLRPGVSGCNGTIITNSTTGIGGPVNVNSVTVTAACTAAGCDDIWNYLDNSFGVNNYTLLNSQLTGPYLNGFTTYTQQELLDLQTQCSTINSSARSVVFDQRNGSQYFACVQGG